MSEKIILRPRNYLKEADFNRLASEWEAKDPDILVIPLTMDVMRGRGRWIYHKDKRWSGGNFSECSVCHYGFSGAYDVDLFKYCPHCGVEMEDNNEMGKD